MWRDSAGDGETKRDRHSGSVVCKLSGGWVACGANFLVRPENITCHCILHKCSCWKQASTGESVRLYRPIYVAWELREHGDAASGASSASAVFCSAVFYRAVKG